MKTCHLQHIIAVATVTSHWKILRAFVVMYVQALLLRSSKFLLNHGYNESFKVCQCGCTCTCMCSVVIIVLPIS